MHFNRFYPSPIDAGAPGVSVCGHQFPDASGLVTNDAGKVKCPGCRLWLLDMNRVSRVVVIGARAA